MRQNGVRKTLVEAYKSVLYYLFFILVLLVYLFDRGTILILTKLRIPQNVLIKVTTFMEKVTSKVYGASRLNEQTINRVNLIDLSIKNMRFKPTRTAITIGGMAVGISAIVFLVSLGYGLQRVVISRVASLNELQQADVSVQIGSQVKITERTITAFTEINEIEHVLPVISVVGKINYNNSITDVASYGVTTEYLKQSATQVVKGELFTNNEISQIFPPKSVGVVAGVQTEEVPEVSIPKDYEYKDSIRNIHFSIKPEKWVRVRSEPSINAPVIGYTKRVEGVQNGVEYWGSYYPESLLPAKDGAPWVQAKVYLWDEKLCDPTDALCIDGRYVQIQDEKKLPVQELGYFAPVFLDIYESGAVLGDETEVVLADEDATISVGDLVSDELTEEDLANLQFDELTNAIADPESAVKKVEMSDRAIKQAVVNRALLTVLGISEDNAIGTQFDVSYVVVGELLGTDETKIESLPVAYTIVGVTADEEAPFFYVPFIDLKSIGINNYSQLKIVSKSQESLPDVRKQVEAMGYSTKSVVDTVNQIDSLFGTLRLVLASIGMVALAVASLGMFNTMSVSLLERTREVGLMKAMGMRSNEVRELFLTESMVMGLFGGISGMLFGMLIGQIVSVFLSVFSIAKGIGYINISYLPMSFIIVIMVLSVIVGFVTGLYPARRATKISALNALRYE